MTFAARTLLDAGPAGSGPPPATFVPVTNVYSLAGTFTETIPGNTATGVGPVQLVIELGGPGGGGSYSPFLTNAPPIVSGSGGSGALSRSIFPLAPTDWGKTFSVTISPGADGGDPTINFNGRNAAACAIISLSFATGVNMQVGGGAGGTWNPSTGGLGGTASGGQTNVAGNTGGGATYFPALSKGGVGIIGNLITSGAGGDASSVVGGHGSSGLSGAGAFAYT